MTVTNFQSRVTEKLNRARLKVEIKRSLRPLAVLGLAGAVGLLAWLIIIGNVGNATLGAKHTVRFTVSSASSVTAGRNPVLLHGVEIGTITGVDLVGGDAVLRAELDSRFGDIYRDARAELRPGTALENMYLDIVDRGTPAAGAASEDRPLPATQTEVAAQVEEVLSAFAPNVRAHMRTTLEELGAGLDGRGADLREAFVQVSPFLHAMARMSRQLAERADLTRTLVSDAATLTEELGQRERDLRRLVSDGAPVLTTVAAASADFDATLRELPPTLAALDSSFAATRRVVGDVDGALRDLQPAAAALPGALAGLERLSADADPALSALRSPVRRLVPLATSLEPLAGRLSDALRRLGPQVGALDHVVRSVGGCTEAINAFFGWTASVAKFDDGRGVFPRGNIGLSLNSPGTATDEPNTTPVAGCSPGMPKVATP